MLINILKIISKIILIIISGTFFLKLFHYLNAKITYTENSIFQNYNGKYAPLWNENFKTPIIYFTFCSLLYAFIKKTFFNEGIIKNHIYSGLIFSIIFINSLSYMFSGFNNALTILYTYSIYFIIGILISLIDQKFIRI